jgi:hypothetical protein
LDEHKLPDDEGGLRRNELGNLTRERAQWWNHEVETKRRLALEEAEQAAIANKKRIAQDKLEAARTKQIRKAECKQAREANAIKKAAEQELLAERRVALQHLRETNSYCYCKCPAGERKDFVMLNCGGGRRCILRGWVHTVCAEWQGDEVTDEMEADQQQFWCAYCEEHNKTPEND